MIFGLSWILSCGVGLDEAGGAGLGWRRCMVLRAGHSIEQFLFCVSYSGALFNVQLLSGLDTVNDNECR